MTRCPGQDMRNWKPEDIFCMDCPFCGYEIEFWKDEPSRICKECQREIKNPRIDLGCAKWCGSANACLGKNIDEHLVANPLFEKLKAVIEMEFVNEPNRIKEAQIVHGFSTFLLAPENGDPRIVKASSLISGAFLNGFENGIELSKKIIQQCTLEDEIKKEILDIIKIICTDSEIELNTKEFKIVKDSFLLAKKSIFKEEDYKMLTESGEMIYNKRFNK